jgi:hypothetical protein
MKNKANRLRFYEKNVIKVKGGTFYAHERAYSDKGHRLGGPENQEGSCS